MKLTKTITLVAAPVPPFVGTRISISVLDDSLRFGIAVLSLADDAATATVDWGDGASDIFSESAENVVHEYARPGKYEIRLSDGFAAFKICDALSGEYHDIFAPKVLNVESSAAKLTTIPAKAFCNCSQMAGASFLSVSSVNGRQGTVPFRDCTALSEIHFPAKSEAAIKATAAYKNNPPLGAPNATIYFDL